MTFNKTLPILLVFLIVPVGFIFAEDFLGRIKSKPPHDRLIILWKLVKKNPADMNWTLSNLLKSETDPVIMSEAIHHLNKLVVAETHMELINIVLKSSRLSLATILSQKFSELESTEAIGNHLLELLQNTKKQDTKRLGLVLVLLESCQLKEPRSLFSLLTKSVKNPVKVRALNVMARQSGNLNTTRFILNMGRSSKVREIQKAVSLALKNSVKESRKAVVNYLFKNLNYLDNRAFYAAHTLIDLNDESILPAITPLLNHSKYFTRRAAQKIIQFYIKLDHVSQIVSKNKGRHEDGNVFLCQILSRFPSTNTFKQLKKLLNSSRWREHDAAARALVALSKHPDGGGIKNEIFQLFCQKVKKGKNFIPFAALEGISSLNTSEGDYFLLDTILKDKRKEHRLYAAIGLDQNARSGILGKLIQYVKKGKKTERLNALEALGLIQSKKSLEKLILWLKENGNPFKKEIAAVLFQITGHDFGPDPDVWARWWSNHGSDFQFLKEKLAKLKTIMKPQKKKKSVGESDSEDQEKENEKTERKAAPASKFTVNIFSARNRKLESLGKYGGSAEAAYAVEAALIWLADHQEPDGKWGEHYTGCTGLALLAFLGAGYTHQNGKFKDTILKGIQWLRIQQNVEGIFETTPSNQISAYGQVIAAYALVEAYGLTQDSSLEPLARKAIQEQLQRQVPGKGWRYSPRLESDISLTGWSVMALKAAQLAGIEIHGKGFSGALNYINDISTRVRLKEAYRDLKVSFTYWVGKGIKDFGYASYSGKRTDTAGMISGLCRILMGQSRAVPYNVGVAKYLLFKHKNLEDEAFFYYVYFGSHFMFQMGGPYWTTWNERLHKYFLRKQHLRNDIMFGKFKQQGPHSKIGGTLYITVMGALALETYYRYLPMFYFKYK